MLLDDEGEPERVEASGAVRMTAEHRDATEVVASFDLRAERVVASPKDQSVLVPVQGRILLRELREPAEDQKRGFRGVVALGWQGQLDYDPQTRLVTARDQVVVAAEPVDAPAFRLESDTLSATLTDAEPAQFAGATAAGNVRLTSTSTTMEAGRVEFSAETGLATATGDAGRPVRLFDESGKPAGQFRLAVYDVQTGRIVRVEDLVAGG